MTDRGSACSCVYVDAGYVCSTISRKVQMARKRYVCGECGTQINPKQRYEHYRGVDEDGTLFTRRTCPTCLELREVFFCEGWVFGEIRESLYEYILEINGEVEPSCILRLGKEARNVVFDAIERAWKE